MLKVINAQPFDTVKQKYPFQTYMLKPTLPTQEHKSDFANFFIMISIVL